MYCRVVKTHLQCCPHDSSFAQMIWRQGFEDAKAGVANTHADDATYNLGYTSGEIIKLEEAKAIKVDAKAADELRGRTSIIVTDDTIEASEPSERHSFPSVTELTLALGERRPAPSVPPPPGKLFEAAQVAAAENVIF